LVSPELALEVAVRGASAALGIGFLEQLCVGHRSFASGGLYAGTVIRLIGAPEFTERFGTVPLRMVLAVGAASGLLGLILNPYEAVGQLILALTFASAVTSRFCRIMGGDGAEQMAILTLFAGCLAILPGPDASTTLLAVFFVGAQLVLSYFTAGFVKAVSPTWRSGAAIELVMNSEAYGQRWIGSFVKSRGALSRLLTKAVFVGECMFPLILIAPRAVALAMVVAGFVFHVATAVTMGLNTFMIAFPATLLCVLVLVENVSPYW
jgi:hypothetical protein